MDRRVGAPTRRPGATAAPRVRLARRPPTGAQDTGAVSAQSTRRRPRRPAFGRTDRPHRPTPAHTATPSADTGHFTTTVPPRRDATVTDDGPAARFDIAS
ncbi:hypothetical protein GCM10023223_32960 [Stackebrandtia albiflava]